MGKLRPGLRAPVRVARRLIRDCGHEHRGCVLARSEVEPFRRPRLLRRDGRPGVQEDLPRAAGDGPARLARLSSHRRRQGRLDARAAAGAGARRASRSTAAASTRRPSPSSSRSCATSTATTATPRRSRSCARRSAARTRPLHYLAIPPELFATVVEALGKSGCAAGARVVVEKPFGRDLTQRDAAQPRSSTRSSTSRRSSASTTTSARRPVQNLLFFRFANTFLEPIWNRQLRRERADHDGRELRRRGPRQVLRRDRARSATWSRTTCSRWWRCLAMEPPIGPYRESIRDELVKVFRAIRPLDPDERGARPVRRATGESRAWRRTRRSRPSRLCGCKIDSWRWDGRAVLHPRRQVPARDGHRGDGRAQAAAAHEARTPARAATTFRFRLGPEWSIVARRTRRRSRARRWSAMPTELAAVDITPSADELTPTSAC